MNLNECQEGQIFDISIDIDLVMHRLYSIV